MSKESKQSPAPNAAGTPATDTAEEFLNLYNMLEDAVAARYKVDSRDSAIGYLVRERREFRALRSELDYCREVRNLLVHRPKVEDNFAVEPTKEMVDLMRRVLDQVENPLRARNVMVPREKVLCAGMDDKVLPLLQEMNQQVYTHIPILEDEKVVGVFSESTLVSLVLHGEAVDGGARVPLDSNTRFSDFADYLPLEKHQADSFRFGSTNERVSTISQTFDRALRESDRLGMIFVTQSGKEKDRLLGIITAWDIAAEWAGE